jgi:putative methyltransferase (TIGR04325 family)
MDSENLKNSNNMRESAQPFFIWEGVYQDFKSAKQDAIGLGFSGDMYNKRSLKVSQECIEALDRNQPIPQFHKQRSTYLSTVVAMMIKEKLERIKILDFGGGYGIGYLSLVESIGQYIKFVDYTIVELPRVCSEGREIFREKIRYKEDFPFEDKINLLHASSSLQYIEDWQSLIKKFTLLKPTYILLSDVFSGNIPTFCSLQNYYESKVPHWFINIEELMSEFQKSGYQLIMKNIVNSKRLGVENELPMENFPPMMRLNYTLHLLFKLA